METYWTWVDIDVLVKSKLKTISVSVSLVYLVIILVIHTKNNFDDCHILRVHWMLLSFKNRILVDYISITIWTRFFWSTGSL